MSPRAAQARAIGPRHAVTRASTAIGGTLVRSQSAHAAASPSASARSSGQVRTVGTGPAGRTAASGFGRRARLCAISRAAVVTI